MAAPGPQSFLRAENVSRVVQALRLHGPLAQVEIAERTGLAAATVSSIVQELRESRVVQVEHGVRSGRRAQRVSLAPEEGVAVGLDFDHRHLRVAVADLAHRILAERSVALGRDEPASAGIALAGQEVELALGQAGVARELIVGVGMGLPGPIDRATGAVGSSAILPGWVGVPAAEAMTAALGLPVLVDNDANLGALGELTWGAGQGHRDVVYVKVSTGVGAGLVLDGRLYRGGTGTAGELGHISVDEAGPICRCGNRGCLEVLVGADAIVELLRRSRPTVGDIHDVLRLAAGGDPGSRRALGDTGRVIGAALANVTNLLNPTLVLVGGEIAGAGEIVLGPLRDALQRGSVQREPIPVQASVLGERAEVLGAVALVLSSAALRRRGSSRTPRPESTPRRRRAPRSSGANVPEEETDPRADDARQAG